MAIIRSPSELQPSVNYLATLALFACVSCLILMLKFGGFKASINFYGRNKKNESNEEPLSLAGAYRINRSEFFESERISTPKNNTTPSVVQPPSSAQPSKPLRPTKSTSDLTAKNNASVNLSTSVRDISQDPRGPNAIGNRNTAAVDQKALAKENKEQMKLEKKRLAEQKAREKNAAKEREREEKLRKKREKEAAREQVKAQREMKKRRPAPAPPLTNPISSAANRQPTSNLSPNQVPRTTPTTQPETVNNNPSTLAPYSSNTMQSSISRSSGPPPYSEVTTNQEINNNGGNVTFSKPIEEPTNSWDLISQHRQQMSKPASHTQMKGPKKNMVMDLQYKLGNENNSEA